MSLDAVALAALQVLGAGALATAFVALRLSRRTGRGLVLWLFGLAVWVAGLVCLGYGLPAAERLLPSGMLLAGATLHTAADVAGDRRWVGPAWLLSGGVAALGLVAPRWLYGPGARGAGPLFVPLAALSLAGTLAAQLYLWRLAARAPSAPERRRRLWLFAANGFGALGGGGAITVHILDLAPAGVAVPFLAALTGILVHTVVGRELGRDRELVGQGLLRALIAAAVTAPLAALAALVLPPPSVSPVAAVAAWFCVVLALHPARQLVVDLALGRLVARPATLRELVGETARLADEVDHAGRLAEMGRLAGAVAHEVRNPLGVILAEAKLLERGGADPEALAAIRAQVARAERFLGDLLRYARPRPLELEEVDVVAETRRAVEDVRRARQLGDGAITVVADGAAHVEADRAAVGDVARILVDNAALAAARVVVTVAGCQVTVDDDGPGVADAIAPRLFQPFVTGRGREGTGLGLALAARLVERHGGRIRHEGRSPLGGARFRVDWPRKR